MTIRRHIFTTYSRKLCLGAIAALVYARTSIFVELETCISFPNDVGRLNKRNDWQKCRWFQIYF